MSEKSQSAGKTGDPPGQGPCETATIPIEALDRFVTAFERSARRWEMIVYPGLAALTMLMAYGFFLIYSLTSDIRMIAERFDPQMGHHMTRLTEHMDSLSKSVEAMNLQVATMTTHTAEMKAISKNMDKIGRQLAEVNGKMTYITTDMGRMRYDMTVMNGNISRPMGFMNSFMPW